MKFTVRMFASTQDGYQFIHKRVDVPTLLWETMMQWAVEQRDRLIEIKSCENEQEEAVLWAPIYESYGAVTAALTLEQAQNADIQAAIAHFFNLAIDNPEMLPIVAVPLSKVLETEPVVV